MRQQCCHGLALGLSLLAVLAQGFKLGKHFGPLLAERLDMASEMLVQMDALGCLLLVALNMRVIDDSAQQGGTVAGIAGVASRHALAMLLGKTLYPQPQRITTASLVGRCHTSLALAQFT